MPAAETPALDLSGIPSALYDVIEGPATVPYRGQPRTPWEAEPSLPFDAPAEAKEAEGEDLFDQEALEAAVTEAFGPRRVSTPTPIDELPDVESIILQPSSADLGDTPPDEPQYLFVGGTAGTGKSYQARQRAERYPDAILCATTGIAAVNLGGTTINSVLQYYDTRDLSTKYELGRLNMALRKIHDSGFRRLIVDEISMMDGRQLDILCMAFDDVNEVWRGRDEPELGLTLTGDFAQLPPVKDKTDQGSGTYAFQREYWARFDPNTILLTEPRRQADPDFVRALQAVRRGDGEAATAYFRPLMTRTDEHHFNGSTILAKNEEVDRYNRVRLLELKTPTVSYQSTRDGEQCGEWKHIPDRIDLKPGCLVMILANAFDPETRDIIYANGDLGTFEEKVSDQVAKVTLHRTKEKVTVVMVRREKTEATGHLGIRADRLNIKGSITYMPLRVAYATTVHKCVVGETRVRVRHGIVPIDQVQHLRADDQRIDNLQVQGFAFSVQPAVRIRTERGYVAVASPDHRWVTRDGLVQTDDLHDRAISLAVGSPANLVPLHLEDQLGWWLGATVGDGTYTDRREGQVHFSSSDQYVCGRWVDEAASLFAIAVAPRKDGRGAYLTSKPRRQQLEAWGLDYVKGPCKRIPHKVWQEERLWLPFLQGLFDTDGSVGRSFVVYATRSQVLGIEVQELLLAVGIVSSRKEYPGVTGPYTQIRILTEQLPLFESLIGFRRPSRAAQLKVLRPNRVIKHFDGFDRVIHVEQLAVSLPMVDVEVDAPHEIGFGPFLGHNSQGLTLDAVQLMIHNHFWLQSGMLYVALSRARTVGGLRIVGTPEQFRARVRANTLIERWL